MKLPRGLDSDLQPGEEVVALTEAGYAGRGVYFLATNQRLLVKGPAKHPATGLAYWEVEEIIPVKQQGAYRLDVHFGTDTHPVIVGVDHLEDARAVVAAAEHYIAAATAQSGAVLRFANCRVYADRIETPQGNAPLRGLRAEVESGGQIARQKSVGYVVAFGVMGLAATKKVDERNLYLSIVGQGLGFAVELHPDRAASARHFAAQVNGMAGAVAGSSGGSEPDILDQVRKLGELHTAGVLTEGEFAAKKADLLGRL